MVKLSLVGSFLTVNWSDSISSSENRTPITGVQVDMEIGRNFLSDKYYNDPSQ